LPTVLCDTYTTRVLRRSKKKERTSRKKRGGEGKETCSTLLAPPVCIHTPSASGSVFDIRKRDRKREGGRGTLHVNRSTNFSLNAVSDSGRKGIGGESISL